MLVRFIRLAIAFLALVALAVLAAVLSPPGAAMAQTVSQETAVTQSNTVVHVDPLLLAFLVGSLMPLLTSVVTRLNASSALKASLNLILSVLGGVLAAFLAAGAGGLTLYEVGAAAIATYLSAQVTYTGFWKPTGAAAAIGNATSGVGLGG